MNAYRDGLEELTISNVNLLIWGTPLDVLDSAINDPTLPADKRASRVRDALGLVHLNPGPMDPERHLFVFRSNQTLAAIRALPSYFSVARPTTLDGFDNHRFCQRDLGGRLPGWGNTVDVGSGICRTGFPEVVLTPMSVSHFTCEYLGKLSAAHFANDTRYLGLLAPPPAHFANMAAHLDAIATAP